MMQERLIGRPMEILLVEDDLDDARMTIETLRTGQVQCRVTLVRDGDEAMQFLRREAHFARAPRPDLILLDMQMPKMNGREVLSEIRADHEFSSMLVVVLTSSKLHCEMLKSEHLQAEEYLLKPVNREHFQGVVKSLRKYILSDVLLPQ